MKANPYLPPPVVLVLGPSRQAVSGVTTHVNSLLGCHLRARYSLVHFQVGSEGRNESALEWVARLLSSPFALAGAILAHDAAIVHINWSLDAKAYWRDLAYMLVAKSCGARVVYQKHGGQLAEFTRNPLFCALVRASFKLPDIIVVLSQAELREYQAFVPDQRVAAVPNGVDPRRYLRLQRSRTDPQASLKLLYMGRLASHKGVSETLHALTLARARGVMPQLVIAGSGPEEARLRAQVQALDLAGQVSFAGPVLGDGRMRLLADADAMVLASYTEGLPYSLLEAMAAGVVPIVTPVGAIPEVVTDRTDGLVVPMKDPPAIADAICRLDHDRAKLARMSQACRERVASAYTLDRLGIAFDGMYASLVASLASEPG